MSRFLIFLSFYSILNLVHHSQGHYVGSGRGQYAYGDSGQGDYAYSNSEQGQNAYGSSGQEQYAYGGSGQGQNAYGGSGQGQYAYGGSGQGQYAYGGSGQGQYGGCKKNDNEDYSINKQCSADIKVTKLMEPLDVGKAPFYDCEDRILYFTDIHVAQVHQYYIDTKEHYVYTIAGGSRVGTIIPFYGMKNKYLIGHGANLAFLTMDDWKTGKGSVQDNVTRPNENTQFPKYFINDVACGSNGAIYYYVVPVVESVDTAPPDQSTLYNMMNRKQKVMISDLKVADGIVFLQDQKTFFYCDTGKNLLYRAEYDQQSNSFSDSTVIMNFTTYGVPGALDSIAVDKYDNLWIAVINGNRLIKVNSKTGEVMCSITTPCKKPTHLAFAPCDAYTEDRNCMYVTSQRSTIENPNEFDGAVLQILGVPAIGAETYKVQYNHIG